MEVLGVGDAGQLASATCRLVAACLAPSRETIPSAREPLDMARLAVIRRHIDRHLCSPDLSPESICKTLRLSRSTLYIACEPLGGVAAFIQRRRLERAYAALTDPRDGRRISEIAYQHGFVSKAHFSRAFRRVFGCSPRDAREAQIAAPPAMEPVISGGQQAAYRNWVHQLCR